MLPASADEMRAAQILTGATMALWILVGLMPSLKKHATPIRVALLSLYLLCCAAVVIYTFVW